MNNKWSNSEKARIAIAALKRIIQLLKFLKKPEHIQT